MSLPFDYTRGLLLVAALLPAACAAGSENAAPVSAPTTTPTPSPNAEAKRAPLTTVKAVNAGMCPATSLIDDAEDGDNRVLIADQRGGYWYTYADKIGSTISPSGSFKMESGGAEGSKYSARMNGKLGNGGILYAGMGFSFTEPKGPYDASCCKGLSFWAKKSGTGTGSVRVKLGDANTAPEGGRCHDCYNDFGADLTLTDSWKKYELTFAELKQEFGWGESQPAIDAAHLYQTQWQVRDAGADFDISVDHIELTGCGK